MAEFEHSVQLNDDDSILIGIPFSKVDERPDGSLIIEGVATAELEDRQNEIVSYEASKAAFSDWPGNLRTMHRPEACGVRISQEFDDGDRAIRLKSFISSAAKDTVQMVKEGILRGYSIGGKATEKTVEKVQDKDGTERERKRINSYNLAEVSLVDAPALPQATFAIVKSEDGQLLLADNVAFVDEEFAKTPGVTLDPAVASDAFGKRAAELQHVEGTTTTADTSGDAKAGEDEPAEEIQEPATKAVATYNRAARLRQKALERGLIPMGLQGIVNLGPIQEELAAFAKAEDGAGYRNRVAEFLKGDEAALLQVPTEHDLDPSDVADVLAELDEEDEEEQNDEQEPDEDDEEGKAASAEDIQKLLDDTVAEAVKPLQDKLDKLGAAPEPRPEDVVGIERGDEADDAEPDAENTALFKRVADDEEASFEDAKREFLQKRMAAPEGVPMTPDEEQVAKLIEERMPTELISARLGPERTDEQE